VNCASRREVTVGSRRPRHRLRAALAAAVVAISASTAVSGGLGAGPPNAPAGALEPILPIPMGREWDPKRVSLGHRLFHDARLSRDEGRSCATCHPLDRGGMDGRTRPINANGTLNARNTPTVFNVGLSWSFNWDGVADTLEAHAETVLRNPNLMDITWPELLARLGADTGYVSAFRAVFPDGLTRRNVLDALATFERSLETPDSRFDRYLRGDRDVLTRAERRGYALFKDYGCAACHQGVNIGGNMFQKFGLFPSGDLQLLNADLGRFQITGASRDRGVFRVPSLRNVAVTAPYFHDGRADSLETAVNTMAKVQLGKTLRPGETGLIVVFLQTLTGRYRGQPIGPVPLPPSRGIEAP
jgi:cytochrome c peroxidase